jgi:hypothetical protein
MYSKLDSKSRSNKESGAMLKDYEENRLDNLFISFHEPLDVVSDLVWLFVVVDGPFETTTEHFLVSSLAWILICVNTVRMMSARRSRKLISEGGLDTTRGARLREIVYAAQQLMLEDVRIDRLF